MNLAIKAIVKPNTDDYNVIADSKGGDPNHVVVVDAHLDAIYGAGMLDNASGSATILDIAQMMRKVHPRNKLRFIWFGGEELGLLGSKAYINSLSPSELSKIGYDLDADVTATPKCRRLDRRESTCSLGSSRRRSRRRFTSRRLSPGTKGSSTSAPSGSTTYCSRRSEPMRSPSTRPGFPRAAC